MVRGGSTWKYRNQQAAWPAGWDGAGVRRLRLVVRGGAARLPHRHGAAPTSTSGRTDHEPRPGPAVPKHLRPHRPPRDHGLRLVTKADDGLVVRVNGQEVGRTSMPAGTWGPPRSHGRAALDGRPAGDVRRAALPAQGHGQRHRRLGAPQRPRHHGRPLRPGRGGHPVDRHAAARHRERHAGRRTPPRGAGGSTTTRGPRPGRRRPSTTRPGRRAPLPWASGRRSRTNIDVPAPTSNRPRSALFRRTFEIDDVSRYSNLQLTTRADDGVLLSLNGVEVNRTRLPTGTLSATSYATAAASTSRGHRQSVVVTVPSLRSAQRHQRDQPRPRCSTTGGHPTPRSRRG